MFYRRLPLVALILPLAILMPGCSSDDGHDEDLVHYDAYPILLADLAGGYAYADEPQDDPPRSRESTFGISSQVEGFQQLRLVAEGGAWTSARVETMYDLGGGTVVFDTLTVQGRLEFRLTVADDPEKVYRAAVFPEGDDFVSSDLVTADWPGGTVDAADLLQTGLDVTLVCSVGVGDEQRVLEPMQGELTSVRLELLEADVLEDCT